MNHLLWFGRVLLHLAFPGLLLFSTTVSAAVPPPQITIPVLVPRQLEPLDKAYVSPPDVALSWTPVEGVNQYQVRLLREDTPDEGLTFVTTCACYTITGLTPGYTYYWSVKALDPVSVESEFFTFTLSDHLLKPRVPGGLQASNGRYNAEVHLSWYTTERASYYRVLRRSTDESNRAVIATVSFLPDYGFIDPNVAVDAHYFYSVEACNTAGCSAPTDEAEGWAASCNPPPPPVLTSPEDGEEVRFDPDIPSYMLNWEAVPNVYEYRVSLVDTATGNVLVRQVTNSTSYEIMDLAGDLEWFVSSQDPAQGCRPGPASEHRALKAIRNPPPAAPVNVTASDGSFPDRIVIDWEIEDSYTMPMEFEVLRAESLDATERKRFFAPEAPYVDTTVTPGVTYYYWVAACHLSRGCSVSAPDSGFAGQTGEGQAPSYLVHLPTLLR